MGSFGLWHWIIVLMVLGIPVAIAGLVAWLVARASKQPPAASRAVPPPIPNGIRPSTASRLQDLAELKEKGLITDAEFEQQRAAILREV